MKKILLLFVLFSLYACDEVLIEENKRIEVRGSLLSLDDAPIPGVEIFSIGSREARISPNTDKILGKSHSGENGNFNFNSLDTYSHGLLLTVNPVEIDHDSSYASLYFYDPTGDHASLYDLEEIALARKLEFQFNISNISGVGDTLIYRLQYEQPVQNFVYEDGVFIAQPDEGNNFVSLREHRPDSDPVTFNLSILEDSEIIFTYGLGENHVEQIVVPVTAENTFYDFEY